MNEPQTNTTFIVVSAGDKSKKECCKVNGSSVGGSAWVAGASMPPLDSNSAVSASVSVSLDEVHMSLGHSIIPIRFSWPSIRDAGKRFIAGFSKHDDMTLAAALAFYTALSLAPLMLLLVTVVGILGPNAQTQLLQQVESVIGSQAGQALHMIVDSTNQRPKTSGWAGIIGILTLIFSASAVFSQLQSSLNVIWEAENKSQSAGWLTYLRKRFLSIGMVLALAFIAIVSLAVSAGLSATFTQTGPIWAIVNVVATLIIFTLLFSIIFKYLPDRKIGWRHVFAGGFATAILFSVGRSLIGLYLGKSAIGSAYGAAGSLIVLLAWVYYSSVIFFMGAEVTRALFSADFEEKTLPAQAPRVEHKFREPALQT